MTISRDEHIDIVAEGLGLPRYMVAVLDTAILEILSKSVRERRISEPPTTD